MKLRSASSALFALALGGLAACGGQAGAPPAPAATSGVATAVASSPAVKAARARVTNGTSTVTTRKSMTPSRADCAVVPVFEAGTLAGAVCADEADKLGLTVLDFSDDWTPRIFAKNPVTGDAPSYRDSYIRLANARVGDTELGLFGISPSMSVLADRLNDDARHACHAKVDASALDVFAKSPEPGPKASKEERQPPREAVAAAQARLACDGFVKSPRKGSVDQPTSAALDRFRRRHMIVTPAAFDRETAAALALSNEERELRALLRGLREHVADAAGLLADGSAAAKRAQVVGRDLDSNELRAIDVQGRLDNASEDLVGQATDAAAIALGWSTPEGARDFLKSFGSAGVRALKVAVKLPAPPAFYSKTMDLRVEIDRGDVFYETPGAAAAHRRQLGSSIKRPSFVLYAKDGVRDVPLVRWGTTIGGWQKELKEDGEVGLAYKESDVGDRVWRQLIAAPAWMPPDSTPQAELLRKGTDGSFMLKKDLIQPGYRNAYGLVMLIHHAEREKKDGSKDWADFGIRTHGSVNYKSIMRGESHGCHRLFNHLMVRMSGFLLAHRGTVRKGKMSAGYQRTLSYEGQEVDVSVPNRGYLYELDPPIPVRVLEGRVRGEAQRPMSSVLRIEDPHG